MIWPNFMNVPPRSWKLRRSGRASWAAGQHALADVQQLAQRGRGEVEPDHLGDGAAAPEQLAPGGVGQPARVDPRHVLGEGTPHRCPALTRRGVRRAVGHGVRVGARPGPAQPGAPQPLCQPKPFSSEARPAL